MKSGKKFTEAITSYSYINLKDVFNIFNSTGDLIKPAINTSERLVNLDREIKQHFYQSSYLMFWQLRYLVGGLQIPISGEGTQSFSLTALSERIKTMKDKSGVKIPVRNLLSNVLQYCLKIHRVFPDFSITANSRSTDFFRHTTHIHVDLSGNAQFASFGRILFHEFLNINQLYSDIRQSGIIAKIAQKKIQNFKAKINHAFDRLVTGSASLNIAGNLISLIGDLVKTIFTEGSNQYSYWNNIARWDGTYFPDTTGRLLRITPIISNFERHLKLLSSLLQSPIRGLGSFRYKWGAKKNRKFLTQIASLIGGESNYADIFGSGKRLEDDHYADAMMRAFGFSKKGRHLLYESQLAAVDFFNLQIFQFFEILTSQTGVSGINYANALSQAYCENALHYKIWLPYEEQLDETKVSRPLPEWVILRRSDYLDYYEGLYSISSKKCVNAQLIGQDGKITPIEFRNQEELHDITSFAKSWVGDKITLNLTGKVHDIKANRMALSLMHTFLKQIALRDRTYAQKTKTLHRGNTKGVAPDSFILLVQNDGSLKKIDTLLIIEHLDLVGLTDAYYSLQKQLDGKAILEHGGVMLEIVDDIEQIAWYLDFPLPEAMLSYTHNGRYILVPKLIGRTIPLIDKVQKDQLGGILRSGSLLLETSKINTLSFKQIMKNCHRIVKQNHTALVTSGFSCDSHIAYEQAIRLQEQFGIQVKDEHYEGKIISALRVTRFVPRIGEMYGYDDEGYFLSNAVVVEKTFIIDMRQFWANVDAAHESLVIARILAEQVNEITAVPYPNITRLMIETYFWHSNLSW